MGYQTDYIGYLKIEPPLNQREVDLVNRISASIYLDRRSTGPRVVDEVEAAVSATRTTAPRGWSNWSACGTGCCLSYDGGDKANHMVPWLTYLMQAFLIGGASAEGAADLDGLTFDHVLNGMVVGSRRDTRELFAITVRDNVVQVELLWPGEPEWSDYPRLAYQVKIDEFRTWVVDQQRVIGP